MPVLIEIPLGDSLKTDGAGSLQLPPVTFRNEGYSQPIVFGTRVLRLSGTSHPMRQNMEQAYRKILDKDLRKTGVRLIHAETRVPPAIPVVNPHMLIGAAFQLELEMEYAETLPSGLPDIRQVKSYTLELSTEGLIEEACEVKVEPPELTIIEGGKQAHLTIRVLRLPPGAQPRIILEPMPGVDDGLQTAIKQGLSWAITRLHSTSHGGQAAFRVSGSLQLHHADKRKLLELMRSKPFDLAACAVVEAQSAPLVIKITTQEKTFPGWLAIDFGTSNSSVTVYDNRKNITVPGLPAEQEAELKQQLEKALVRPPAGVALDQWQRFLEQLNQNLRGVDSIEEAIRHGDENVRYQVLRQMELQLATLPDENMRNRINNWLYELYHEALRVPPLSKLSLQPIELEAAAGEAEISSELRIDELDDPLVVTMGRKVKRDREEKLRQPDQSGSVQVQFHHSPKRYVGQDREIIVGVGDNRQSLPSSKLVQAAWNQLIKLTDAYRLRSRDRFTPGQMRHAIVTYPTVSSPFVRREIERLVRELGLSTVQTDYDEAISAAIFYLMREVGGIPDLGMEAFKARCRSDGRRWWRNVLVLDIGGGSTDVALIRLTLEEENPFTAGEDAGAAGRYYRIVPELMGSTGHLQLGGELVTLRTFELLKTAIADQLLTAASQPQPGARLPLPENSPLHQHLGGILSGLSERFRDVQDKFVSGSLLLQVLNRQNDGIEGGTAQEALDIANQVLPTRWANDPAALEPFYELWELAEAAKIQLGQLSDGATSSDSSSIYSLSWHQVQKLLRLPVLQKEETPPVAELQPVHAGAAPAAEPDFAVTIDRRQFERNVSGVIRDAVNIARGLVKSRLEEQPGELLDWLILSGKTCYLDLVHREVRRIPGETSTSAWKPKQVTFVPKYAKLATSVGACYAEYLRQYRFNSEGAKQLLRKGYHQLYFDIHNLFFYLPCSFVREVVGGFETIFKAGDPMYQLDDEPIGKVRSPWTRPTLTTGVHRQDFPMGAKIKWGSFSAADLLSQLDLSDTQFIHDYKIQFEVNQRLQFQLLLCKGSPNFYVSNKLPSLSLAPLPGSSKEENTGDVRCPVAGVLACDIAVKLGQTEEILFARGSELVETFHCDDGATRRGVVSGPLPSFPVSGRHTLMVRTDFGWTTLGEFGRPDTVTEYPCQYRVSLDEQGTLRLHTGEVPYLEMSTVDGLEEPGCVYRLELELFPTQIDVMRDPFSGIH